MKESNYYLITSITDLNIRSLNIINEIGGINSLIEFYNLHKSFHQLRKVGTHTNTELISYCKYLTETEGSEFYINPIQNNKTNSQYQILSEPEAFLLSEIYLKEKSLLKKRTRNVLDKLELEVMFDSNTNNKRIFFETFFLIDFDYKKLPNIGSDSERQLIQLRNKLKEEIENLIDDVGIHNFERKILLSKLSDLFKEQYSEELVNLITSDNNYKLKIAFCLLLYYSGNTNNNLGIIDYYLFDSNIYTHKEISQKLECSPELVRITIRAIDSKLIQSIVSQIKSTIPFDPIDVNNKLQNSYLDLPNIEEFTFQGNHFTPNTRLTKLFYQNYFINSFNLIDVLIKSNKLDLFCFDFTNKNILISIDLTSKTDFVNLLIFLNEEIYNFESIGFEYNLKVLISRFYNEKSLCQNSTNELEVLYQIVSRILVEKFEVDPIKLRKLKSNEITNNVLDIAERLINESNSPIKTQTILEEVQSNGIEITTQQLLHKLGKSSSTFVRIGNSLWGLRNESNLNGLGGSLRDMIEDILIKRENPIHISELLEIITKIRPISIHSLLTNLRVAENHHFKFFHCSFIGLGNKKYNSSWDSIPKLNPGHLRKAKYKFGKNFNINEVTEYLFEKYGYPQIHIRYLLSNNEISS